MLMHKGTGSRISLRDSGMTNKIRASLSVSYLVPALVAQTNALCRLQPVPARCLIDIGRVVGISVLGNGYQHPGR